ncbi:hypothetical protein CASFOL_002706 [Castilleja foliolosa]|uniref:GATA-type domain-containing protein n=1 Tax=Castilleja foliolosa TaxID=1961234 RepID=A0ABD3EF16_9LAMI
MSVVEPGNCWDAIPDDITGDEEFDNINILDILDFPMESLGDNGFVADWDITKPHCLGPLMGPPMMPDVKVETIPPFMSSGLVTPIAEAQDQKQPSTLVEPSGPRIIQPSKLPEAQESSVFQTQSPDSVLESSGGSCSSSKSDVHMRARSKRHKRASSWLSPSTYFITDEQTPIPRKYNKGKKKKLPDPEVEISLQAPNCPISIVTQRCTHCQVTETPQWRGGPLGRKTLCNACGVRYRSGRLFPEYRPVASPTFVPALHSNSHKKVVAMRIKDEKPMAKTEEPPVVEMRIKGKKPMAITEEPPATPQPEVVPMSNYLFDNI